jgi:transcription elongation factor Elf1
MGRKKRVIRIPEQATIKCIHCGKKSRRKVPIDSSPQYFDCDKCGQRTQAPITSCCIICAFTNKKCAPALLLEAKSKGLEIRYPVDSEK